MVFLSPSGGHLLHHVLCLHACKAGGLTRADELLLVVLLLVLGVSRQIGAQGVERHDLKVLAQNCSDLETNEQ